MTLEEAEDAIRDMLAGNAFGEAGSRVVIEEFLEGEEASFIVMVDGKNILPFTSKITNVWVMVIPVQIQAVWVRLPAPVVIQIHDRIMAQIIEPTVKGMAAEGNDYVGFLYAV